MESALTTSPPSRWASATASAVLPVAVGPTTATTGGPAVPGSVNGYPTRPPGSRRRTARRRAGAAPGTTARPAPPRPPATPARPRPAAAPPPPGPGRRGRRGRPPPARHTGTPAASSRSPSTGSRAARAAGSPSASARTTPASKGPAAGSRCPGAFSLRRAEPSPIASTPTGPGTSTSAVPRSSGPTPSRGPAWPAWSSSQAPRRCGSGTRRPPGRTEPANGSSTSTPNPRRSPASPGPNRTPSAPAPTTTTVSGRISISPCTATEAAARSSDRAGLEAPATAGSSRGGWGQKATVTGRGGLTRGSVADGSWNTAGVSSTENTADRTQQAPSAPDERPEGAVPEVAAADATPQAETPDTAVPEVVQPDVPEETGASAVSVGEQD